MNILFHTIAIERERWTPKRVSRPLIEILGPVAGAGFRELEIHEPHLGAARPKPKAKPRKRKLSDR